MLPTRENLSYLARKLRRAVLLLDGPSLISRAESFAPVHYKSNYYRATTNEPEKVFVRPFKR